MDIRPIQADTHGKIPIFHTTHARQSKIPSVLRETKVGKIITRANGRNEIERATVGEGNASTVVAIAHLAKPCYSDSALKDAVFSD